MIKSRARRLQAIRDREKRDSYQKLDTGARRTTRKEKSSRGNKSKRELLSDQRPATRAPSRGLTETFKMSTVHDPHPSDRARALPELGKRLERIDDPSAALLRYGGGQILGEEESVVAAVLATITKTPLQDRVNPLIKPASQEFAEKEKQFLRLIRNSDLSLDQILDSSFSEHEISLITPASGPPELVQWQKENTVRYNQLLKTTFKGKKPSVQLKLTMAYFGFPVAPLKMGWDQAVAETDFDFLNKIWREPDPLNFLEYFEERCWGDPDRRGESPYFYIVASISYVVLRGRLESNIKTATQTNWGKPIPIESLKPQGRQESVSLRGGSLENDPQDYASDGNTIERLENLQPKILFRVMGFQGIYCCPSREYSAFVDGVTEVLSFNYLYDFDIHAHFYETDRSGAITASSKKTVEGTIGSKGVPVGCPIWAEIQRRLGSGNSSHNSQFAVFVHYKGEEFPTTPVPNESERLGTVKFTDFTTGNVAYMRVPETPNNNFQQHHYSSEFYKTIRVLFPDAPLQDYTWWVRKQSGEQVGVKERSFGWLDPPPQLWDKVVRDIEENDELEDVAMTDVQFVTRYFPEESVPIVVPGFYSWGDKMKTLRRADLRLHNSDEDDRQLQIIREALWESNSHLRNYPTMTGIDIWLSGENFMRSDKGPFQVQGNGSAAVEHWRRIAHTHASRTYDANPPPEVSIVARPVFRTYQIWEADGWKSTVMDLNKTSRAEFVKAVVENLFPGEMSPNMWPSSEQKCLHIRHSTWGRSPVTAAIRPDTSDEEWSWIVRHIVEPDITVSIEEWDVSWGKQNLRHEHSLFPTGIIANHLQP